MPSPDNPPLIAIVGPTAVGKTALALWLSERLPVEVVSADSRQVYRGMDIGTAKPMPAELGRLPHHLIDLVDPDESFTLAQYQSLAYEAINDILKRDKLPLLVGGTGLYIRAVLEGLTIPAVPPDPELREALFAQAAAEGEAAFHERLRQIDPAAAERLDPRNVRRVVRALEVCLKTGRPISEQQKSVPPPYHILQIGLTMPREALYERVDRRVDAMIAAGLVEEVRGLVARGYGYDLPSMSGLGYQQIGLYLRGEITLDEAIALIKRHTRRFIRHQYNWFHPNDARIRWFDLLSAPYETIAQVIGRIGNPTDG
jgi:tRNA dimethylallyltransferase